jgi:hypothetical protein
VRIEAYTCSDPSECKSHEDGVCEPTGYCSYPDPSCASQRRYSALAGPYAGECTDAAVGSTEPPDPSTSSVPLESSSGAGSSDGDGPVRATDASTETEPVPHGEVLWSFLYAGDALQEDVFWAVEPLGDDDAFIVAGYEHTVAEGRNALLVRYRGPEDVAWLVSRDVDGGTDDARGMVRGDDGALYVAGAQQVGGVAQGWIGRYLAGGEQVWISPTIGSTSLDIASTSDGLLCSVLWESSTTAYVVGHWSSDRPAWEHTLPATDRVRLSAAAAGGADVFVGGELDATVYLARVDDQGLQRIPLKSVNPDGDIQGLVTTADAIFAAGSVTTSEGNRAWLARLDFDGEIVWERANLGATHSELESLVVGDDGDLFVVGFSGSLINNNVMVARWSQAGDEVWSRTYPELDHGTGIARDVAVLAGGDLLVVGQVHGPSGDIDALAARIVP